MLAEDFERTRVILRGHDEGLLAHVGPDFQCGSIGARGRRGFRGVPLAQDSNVFQRQAEAQLQFGVIDVDEPLADSFLTRIVAGPNQPADEPDRVTSGLAENAVSTFREN